MSAALLMPGATLGKYEIVRELAIGGMAAIYLARVRGTAGFEKHVVLKCILPSLATDRALVSMFLDEARLAATLRHSNIAAVFDVGAEGDHYYFAMEYVDGETARTLRLTAKERNQPIPLEVALATVLGTAAALHYAHDRIGPSGPLELVHRDVSPSNIMVGYEGAVKLVDFGIARARLRSGAKTRTGMRKGKVPYMSPEQCRGHAIDRRSDLFSLGTVLYELTTTMRPFLGNSDFEVMDAIVTGAPRPPSQIVPGYPPELERVVMRLLARVPGDRYQHALAVIEDLEALAAQRSLSTSALVVARYMRALFSSVSGNEHDTYTDFGNVARTREYPQVRANPDEEPTAAFTRAEQLWSPEAKVSRSARTTSARGEDISTTAAFAERTRQDVIVPFDPIDARSAEILTELDAGAPANETASARAYRRVETLLQQADGWLAMDEPDKAVAAVELALDEDMTSAEVQGLMQSRVEMFIAVYEAMLEDPYRTPALAHSPAELADVPLESGSRELLPLIDGIATVKDIIARSGMERLEAYHHLCQLLLRGVLR